MKMKIKLNSDQEDKVVVNLLKYHYTLIRNDESTNIEDQVARVNHLIAIETLLRYFMVESKAEKWLEKEWK